MVAKVNKKALITAAYPIACLVIGVLWYHFLYAPKSRELNDLKQELEYLKKEVEANTQAAIAAAVQIKRERAISQRYRECMARLPKTNDVASVMIQITKIGRGKNLRIVSLKPSSSELFSESGAGDRGGFYVKHVQFTISLEGRYIDVNRFLFELSNLPFFRDYASVCIGASEIYPRTTATIACTLYFL